MFDFLLGNLYIIVIIAFAIFTAISSRSGKNKSRTRPGMPTFGGGPDTPGRRLPGQQQTTQEREADAQRRYHEAQRQFDREQMDRGSAEGRSQETMSQEGTYRSEGPYTASDTSEGSRMEREPATEMGRTADQYRNEMQQRLDQLTDGMNDRLDRMNLPSTSSSPIEVTGDASSSAGGLRLDPAQATQGVLWAEILSPPRSRHAGSFGRKASREQQSNEA